MSALPHGRSRSSKELDSLLSRLDHLAMVPGSRLSVASCICQGVAGVCRTGAQSPLAPLPEEVALADLLLYADFIPRTGS